MADTTTYGSVKFCDVTNAAEAGYHWLLCIYTADGSELLAVAGQQSLDISRSADSTEVTSKTTDGGWKSYISGMKEWSIDTDGAYVKDTASHELLAKLFEAGDLVCVKVVDADHGVELFGGLAAITDYSISAPYDDAVTYTLSLQGSGALVDLTVDTDQGDGKTTPDGE